MTNAQDPRLERLKYFEEMDKLANLGIGWICRELRLEIECSQVAVDALKRACSCQRQNAGWCPQCKSLETIATKRSGNG